MHYRVVLSILLALGILTACATAEPGPITFGLAVNELTGEVENPQTRFRLSDDVAWIATLHAPVEGTKVDLDITTESGAWVFGYEQFVTDPEGTTLVNEMPLGRFLPDPGVYVMRYVSLDGEVLAEGEFELHR